MTTEWTPEDEAALQRWGVEALIDGLTSAAEACRCIGGEHEASCQFLARRSRISRLILSLREERDALQALLRNSSGVSFDVSRGETSPEMDAIVAKIRATLAARSSSLPEGSSEAPTHCCGARGFGLAAGDVCPACVAQSTAALQPTETKNGK
jgi:hypothetical protein